jgi:nucleoside-diphosphate-sugar epimerase
VKVLVLGAGYIGGKLGELALGEGHEVTLADNWFATERSQLARLEAGGARVETADIRDRGDLGRLLRDAPDRLYLLAAQASRPVSEQNPDYTEATNVTGVRLVAEAVGAAPVRVPVVFGSSLHVYGPDLRGTVGSEHPYGEQRDLAHLSKVYGELVLRMHAAEAGFDLALLRLGIVYGRSPVEHEAPESQTVVDRFRRLAAARRELPVDDAETALGIVHVDDAARILLSAPDDRGVSAANVAAETVTVGDLARLATGDRPTGSAGCLFTSPFAYEHRVADFLQP